MASLSRWKKGDSDGLFANFGDYLPTDGEVLYRDSVAAAGGNAKARLSLAAKALTLDLI